MSLTTYLAITLMSRPPGIPTTAEKSRKWAISMAWPSFPMETFCRLVHMESARNSGIRIPEPG